MASGLDPSACHHSWIQPCYEAPDDTPTELVHTVIHIVGKANSLVVVQS